MVWSKLKKNIENNFSESLGDRVNLFTSEYGDRNTISFVYHGTRYDLTFYLGTFKHYDTLIQIMKKWREKGIDFSARSAFTDSYIREQENRLG